MAKDETKPVHLEYERRGADVRFRMQNVDVHELRTFIVGLWGCLEPRQRLDMIRELGHYHESPVAEQPLVSRALAGAYHAARAKGEPPL